jgi:methylated-DNA-protein-cysteine methyltransferase related protein
MKEQTMHEKIFSVVREIPQGKVCTYGQIANIIGIKSARVVGYAMAAAPFDIPWHRVVNSKGMISIRKGGEESSSQRELLLQDGIIFKKSKIDLREYLWESPLELL